MTDNVTISKSLAEQIGDKIRVSRKEARVTVRAIAAECEVDPRTVSRWQAGKYAPSIAQLNRIAALVGKSPGYFLNEAA